MAVAPKNYIKVLEDFAAHWTLANAALGASPIVLTGNYTLASFLTDKASMATLIAAADVTKNAMQNASADRDVKRAPMRERLRQFRAMVAAAFPRSVYEGELDPLPQFKMAAGAWTSAMNQVADTWAKINAIAPPPIGTTIPMVLAGGYARATFLLDQTALVAAFALVESTQRNDTNARETRDALWAPTEQRLRQYRLMVQARFATGSAILNSLPALTPPRGHTPTAVSIMGVWNPAISKAVITYTASADADLYSYELRACYGGTKYDVDNETTILTHLAGDLSPFETDLNMPAPGSVAFYKVYVVLSTGNEKGSRAVKVIAA